jgi:hypothetical protein
MAVAVQPLTLEEFRARYQDQKPYFEYWFGEAIQKTVPTWLHARVLEQDPITPGTPEEKLRTNFCRHGQPCDGGFDDE